MASANQHVSEVERVLKDDRMTIAYIGVPLLVIGMIAAAIVSRKKKRSKNSKNSKNSQKDQPDILLNPMTLMDITRQNVNEDIVRGCSDGIKQTAEAPTKTINVQREEVINVHNPGMLQRHTARPTSILSNSRHISTSNNDTMKSLLSRQHLEVYNDTQKRVHAHHRIKKSMKPTLTRNFQQRQELDVDEKVEIPFAISEASS
jgi:hypothetical protein